MIIDEFFVGRLITVVGDGEMQARGALREGGLDLPEIQLGRQ